MLIETVRTFQAIDALLYVSEGDMRKAITYLQSVARLKGEETLTKADVYEIAGVRPMHLSLVFCCMEIEHRK